MISLTKLSGTASTITLGWTPPAGVGGYVFYANGVAVSTGSPKLKDGTPRASAKFSKTNPGPPFEVAAVCRVTGGLKLETGVYMEAPPPGPGGLLGLCLNAGPSQTWLDRAVTLRPRVVREDTIYQGKVDWAAANGAEFIGLLHVQQTGVAGAMATVNAWPTITKWELDNEPYFANVNVASWAQLCLQLAQQIKAAHPSHEVILPMLVQANRGDYLTGGQWSPWATQVMNAAPGLKQFCDTVSGHPYTNDGGIAQPPSFAVATVDKVRGQLQSAGWTPDWHMTELGWSVGVNPYQVSATTQAQYLSDMVGLLRARSWVRSMEVYCLQTWGSGYEESFGLFNQDLSERPAAATFRSLV